MPAPPLPDTIAASALDAAARRDLGGLQKDLAEAVARHLVAAGTLVDDDPAAALAHARYARRRASRIAVVREAAGITAYHAGEWAEALAELRAARRMGGGPGHLAVMADIERALGRPERAIELARSSEARELPRSAQIELAVVVAGARRDLGEFDAAVVALQVPELEASRRDPWSARLFYAYADNLLAAGRESDALQWFVHAANADPDGLTDADVRIAELTGEPLADEGIEFALDEEDPDDESGAVDSPEGDNSAIADAAGHETGHLTDAPAAEAVDDAASDTAAPTAGLGSDGTDGVDGPADPTADVTDAEASGEVDRAGVGEATAVGQDDAPAIADDDTAPVAEDDSARAADDTAAVADDDSARAADDDLAGPATSVTGSECAGVDTPTDPEPVAGAGSPEQADTTPSDSASTAVSVPGGAEPR